MAKFLATYMGAQTGTPRPALDDDGRKRFMAAWGEWVTRFQSQIVDGGGPVGKTKLVNEAGVSTTRNAITAYTIVEAASHDAAAQMFVEHPHIRMLGLSVEVMELHAIPAA